ncbi:TPA: terminase small subunit [Escherichia coli]
MAFLLNKSDMASSIGISVQAFDKWGVPPVERRGREVLYDVKTVLEIDRERRQHNQRTPDDGGELEERLLRARAELTEEQAVAQKLKNQVTEGKLIDSDFCVFALSKLAMALSSTLDSIPLSMQRQFRRAFLWSGYGSSKSLRCAERRCGKTNTELHYSTEGKT